MTCFISLVSYANKSGPVENGVSIENVINFNFGSFMPEADVVVVQQAPCFENEIILYSIESYFLPEAASIEYQSGSAIKQNYKRNIVILSVEVVRRSGRLNNGVNNINNLSLKRNNHKVNALYAYFEYSMRYRQSRRG